MHLVRTLILLAVLGTAQLAAQVDSGQRPASQARAGRVLTHTFSSPSREFVRVRLESNQTYLAQLNVPGVRLEIRALSPGVLPPVIQDRGQSGGLVYFEIRTRGSSEYEIRLLGERAMSQPVRITLDRRP